MRYLISTSVVPLRFFSHRRYLKKSDHPTHRTVFDITFNRRRLIRFLTWITAWLLFMHGTIMIYHYQVSEVGWYFMQLFDVNEEHNLPTWFSGFNLLIATLILGIIVKEKRRLEDDMTFRWTVLFVGFCFLSIDEVAVLHETVNSVIEPSWAWGGLVIAVVVGVYFIPFLRSLPKRSFRDFFLAGAVYVGGAVIMELLGEPLDSDSLAYNMTTLVEEGMEMFGIVLFSKALLTYLMGGKDEGNVSLRT